MGQSYLQSRSLYGGGQLHARMGTANIGGGSETPSYTNVNPFMEGTGGPTSGVSNHVNATFSEIDQVFQAGTVQRIVSYRLPAGTVNWNASAQSAYRVLADGGTVEINIWSISARTTQRRCRPSEMRASAR